MWPPWKRYSPRSACAAACRPRARNERSRRWERSSRTPGTGLSARAVFDRLVARERLGSTGIGEGCALPHARVPGLDCALAAFLRLEKGVDFDSPDREPVDLVIGLLVPEESTDEHLELLAGLARTLSDESVRTSVRSADEPARIREALIRNNGRA